MKTFALLTALLLLSLIAFSQPVLTLKPINVVHGSDTLKGFNKSQYREIARELSVGDNCLQQLKEYQIDVQKADSIILMKDRQMALCKTEIYSTQQMYGEQKKISDGLKSDKAVIDKKLKRQKRISKVLAMITLVLTVIVVTK